MFAPEDNCFAEIGSQKEQTVKAKQAAKRILAGTAACPAGVWMRGSSYMAIWRSVQDVRSDRADGGQEQGRPENCWNKKKGLTMSQTMAKNRVLTLLLALATALAMSLAIAPMAFAVDWNSSVKVTAVGGNTGSDAGGDKTESGQYISVEMKFTGSPNLSQIDNDTAESYLQENITIAGRHIDGTTAGYVRDVYDVVVDNSAKTITFKIAYNTAGTTANYNGRLLIAKNSTANSVIAEAMDADVETIIGTGVAIANNSGTNNADGSKTFEISSAAFNRGMVHVLIVDDYGALFTNTGTFSNGGLTVHAHEFASQIPADFAALICANANSLVTAENNTYETGLGYVFTDLGDGTFKVTDSDGDCSDVKVYIYDCNYLNTYALAVGAIYEPEIVNP